MSKALNTLTASAINLKEIGDDVIIMGSVESAREKISQNGNEYMQFKGVFEGFKDGESQGVARKAILPFCIEQEVADQVKIAQDKKKTANFTFVARIFITRDESDADKKVWNYEFLTDTKKVEVKDPFADLKAKFLAPKAGTVAKKKA